MQFQQSIQKWKTLAGIGNKVSTQKYHAEIEKIILNNWTARAQKIDTVTDKQCSDFVLSVAHYSAPRFNAVMSAMRSILPGRSQHFQFRTVRVKHRDNVSQLKFQTLLTELDARPKSHAGLIVRFLSVTGLRIGAAGKLKWSDVNWEDCFIIAPGSIMKNGKPCLIPFVNGTRDVLERLQKITGDSDFILPQTGCPRALRTACKLAEMPNLTHHDFRHIFTTRCIESGVDIPTVARWRGDSDNGALLLKVYVHLADSHSRKMASRVQI